MIAASSLSFITSEARRCMARIVATMLVVMAADVSVVAEGTRVAADGRVQTAERKSDTLRPELRQDRRPGRQALRELQRDIDGILASRDFSRANIGVSVVSADNGEVIYRMNDERMFVPASTQKLFTTAVALETLGKDFRYSTRLYLDGTTSPSGEFRGNMIVRGSGDPTWSAFFRRDALAILDTWVATLDSLGITGVRGSIVVDDTYFDDERSGPGWMLGDLTYPFSPQVSALNAYDNTVELRFAPGAEDGAMARHEVIPEKAGVEVQAYVTTTASDDIGELHAVRTPGTNRISVTGSVVIGPRADSAAASVRVTVQDPAMYVGTLFKNALEHHRMRVRADVVSLTPSLRRKSYAEMDPVCESFSPPLREIVNVINTHSHNLCAESLIKTVGKESTGRGSWESGTECVKRALSRMGMQQDDFVMVDGSGLSRLNLCSPSQLTFLLNAMLKSPVREEFVGSLATPGGPGTLRNRIVGTLAEKHLKAKTGSMNNVSTLAGYVTTRDNETLCFALMLNNFTVPDALARTLQDVVCMRLASFSRKTDRDR